MNTEFWKAIAELARESVPAALDVFLVIGLSTAFLRAIMKQSGDVSQLGSIGEAERTRIFEEMQKTKRLWFSLVFAAAVFLAAGSFVAIFFWAPGVSP